MPYEWMHVDELEELSSFDLAAKILASMSDSLAAIRTEANEAQQILQNRCQRKDALVAVTPS